MTTILIADDHDVVRRGLKMLLETRAPWRVVAEARDGKGAVSDAFRMKPDVAIIDYGLPKLNGIEAARQIRHHLPRTEILIFTMHNSDDILLHALEAGARGFLLKTMPPAEVIDAIRLVHAGRKRIPPAVAERLAEHLADESLTPREVEVLRHVAEGSRNKDIADRLSISEETVKVHVKHIMDKLGAADRTEAVAVAIRRGIIQL